MPAAEIAPDTLRHRLNQLASAHSQAELARRTGFPPANVHRFMKGGKVPAEFCQALVRELGINPAWLLAGEGTAYLADVSAGTERMASNMLELVEAMSAVSRMRLGSLTGKHHLRVLRELSDALDTHEKLRSKLNQGSLPVFEKLVSDLESVLDKRDLDRGAELLKAADQVARLCDDDALMLRLDAQRAFFAYLQGDTENSATWRRKVFIRQMAWGEPMDEKRILQAQFLVMAVLAMGRVREALRICNAALALSNGVRGRNWCVMLATGGLLEMDLGDLQGGMAKVMRALPEAAPVLHDLYGGYFAKMQLFSGLGDVETCIADKPMSSSKSLLILRFAIWLEDGQALTLAVRRCISSDRKDALTHAMADNAISVSAMALLEVLKQPSRKVCTAQLKRVDALGVPEHRTRVLRQIVKTQLLRVARLTQPAREQLRLALTELERVSSDITLPPDYLAVHHRNVLELADDSMSSARSRANGFFSSYFHGGYACFKRWADLAQTQAATSSSNP
ncbi:MAG: helix-turn-helix transcriptional regulator [Planctomycetes bacterium]|nr:helix-turn-helix transcriptional regulator [Planctomycetota bacterium]